MCLGVAGSTQPRRAPNHRQGSWLLAPRSKHAAHMQSLCMQGIRRDKCMNCSGWPLCLSHSTHRLPALLPTACSHSCSPACHTQRNTCLLSRTSQPYPPRRCKCLRTPCSRKSPIFFHYHLGWIASLNLSICLALRERSTHYSTHAGTQAI